MRPRRFRVLSIVILTGILLVTLGPASGQAPGPDAGPKIVRLRKPEIQKVRTPEYRITTGTMQGRSREWYQITAEYDTAPEWVDEMTFQFYVLVKGHSKHTLFRGDVTYVNIERGNRHKSVMYLHPSTVARYGEVERVAVLIMHEGRLVAMESEPSSAQRWWEQLTPVSGYVLNRMQTPFAMINFDDYEAIKAAGDR